MENKWIQKIIKKNDPEAADSLISHYYKEIYAYVYKQTTDKELAMDLTQEIFMGMLKSLPGYDSKKAGFRTWLYKIATYRVVDYYRSRAYKMRQLSGEMEVELADASDFTFDLENRMELERVNEFVNGLDSQAQQIFRLKLYGEYAFHEIAKSLDMPESSVKTKYYGVMKQIRSEFQ
ncbi:MAG: sigma-70 family RNA polymerase sigma factor [Turicibacter sp.]|nr:sigma-70 family RNA polymerase sigma factor [Turicibacter sp.]